MQLFQIQSSCLHFCFVFCFSIPLTNTHFLLLENVICCNARTQSGTRKKAMQKKRKWSNCPKASWLEGIPPLFLPPRESEPIIFPPSLGACSFFVCTTCLLTAACGWKKLSLAGGGRKWTTRQINSKFLSNKKMPIEELCAVLKRWFRR